MDRYQTSEAEKATRNEFLLPCVRAHSRKDAAFFHGIFRNFRNFIERLALVAEKHVEDDASRAGAGSGNLEWRNETDVLRFAISSRKMQDLLAHRMICAADVRCLDADSKQCLKKLCLKTCLSKASLIQRTTQSKTNKLRQYATRKGYAGNWQDGSFDDCGKRENFHPGSRNETAVKTDYFTYTKQTEKE